MISKIVKLYENINAMVDKCDKELGLNDEINIEAIISEYVSGFEESVKFVHNMNNEVLEIKKEMNGQIKKLCNNLNELDEVLLKADNIKLNADDFKKKAKSLEEESRPCCTPFVKNTTYIFLVLLTLFIIYAVTSLIRCDSLNIAC
jgi:uncharacterized coiled-coil DUF342 family protein